MLWYEATPHTLAICAAVFAATYGSLSKQLIDEFILLLSQQNTVFTNANIWLHSVKVLLGNWTLPIGIFADTIAEISTTWYICLYGIYFHLLFVFRGLRVARSQLAMSWRCKTEWNFIADSNLNLFSLNEIQQIPPLGCSLYELRLCQTVFMHTAQSCFYILPLTNRLCSSTDARNRCFYQHADYKNTEHTALCGLSKGVCTGETYVAYCLCQHAIFQIAESI